MDVPGGDELLIKHIMISIAMVNKYWFSVLSNNLKVCVDFNYWNQGKYTIVKKENIETIILSYSHESFYTDTTSYFLEGQIDKEFIRNEIKELTELNCKQLLLRNSYDHTRMDSINELDVLLVQFENVHLLEYEINGISNPTQLSNDQHLINQVFSIKFNNFFNFLLVNQVFSHWSKSIKQLYLVSSHWYGPNYPFFKYLSGEIECKHLSNSNDFNEFKDSNIAYRKYKEGNNGVNYFKDLEVIRLIDVEIEIEDICIIMSSTENLKHFQFELCFNNLIYFLLTDEERSTHSNINRCNCDSIIQDFPDTHFINENGNDIAKFKNHWETLKSKVKSNNSTLVELSIFHSCGDQGEDLILGNQDVPNSFIKEFSQFIYLFSSLEKLEIRGINTPKFFEEILKYNNSITSFNIIAYDNSVNDFQMYTDSLNQLAENNSQIKRMVFSKNLISEDKLEDLLDYKCK